MNLSLQQKIIAGVVAIAVLAGAGWCVRRNGISIGSQDQRIKVAASTVQVKRLDAVVVDKAAKVEIKKSVTKRAEYNAARAKVELKGDTVIADGQTVVLPSVASLIKVADARGAQDSTTIVKQSENTAARDSLIASLDSHVDLLQEAKRPRCSTKCGVVIGTVGTVAVVVMAVKVIKAVAKR